MSCAHCMATDHEITDCPLLIPQNSLNDIGRQTRAWQDRNFQPDKVRSALQLCEEAGEVARAVGKEQDGIRPNSRGSVAAELGDVVLSAAALADRHGIDLEHAVKARLERCLALDFVTHPEEGVATKPNEELPTPRTVPIVSIDIPEKELRPVGQACGVFVGADKPDVDGDMFTSKALEVADEKANETASSVDMDVPPGCTCELRNRSWNPFSGICGTCGNPFRDLRQGLRSQTAKPANTSPPGADHDGDGDVEADRLVDVLANVVKKMDAEDEETKGSVDISDALEPVGPDSFGGEDYPSMPSNIDDHVFVECGKPGYCGRCGNGVYRHTRL